MVFFIKFDWFIYGLSVCNWFSSARVVFVAVAVVYDWDWICVFCSEVYTSGAAKWRTFKTKIFLELLLNQRSIEENFFLLFYAHWFDSRKIASLATFFHTYSANWIVTIPSTMFIFVVWMAFIKCPSFWFGQLTFRNARFNANKNHKCSTHSDI